MIIGKAEVLNSKKIKEITGMLEQQWGYSEKLGCGFMQKENDIFMVTRAIDAIDLRKLNVNSAGLYFAELRNNELRLSIEGSQIIGRKATKNVVELSRQQLQQWLRREDIELNGRNSSSSGSSAYVIIRHGNDFFGCGRIKDSKLLNFIPKARMVSQLIQP